MEPPVESLDSARCPRPQPRLPDRELAQRICERAGRLALARPVPPGGELELWLEAEAQVKREAGLPR